MLGGGILTVREYLPVTAYAEMYAYWYILSLLLNLRIIVVFNVKVFKHL
jgi:hypothetical protein